MDTVTIASFAAVCLLLGVAYGLSRRLLTFNASIGSRLAFMWFAFDGLIHLVFEGSWLYLSLGGRTVNTSSGPFADLCKSDEYTERNADDLGKEYAKADSRWGVADASVLAVELPTVLICTPLAFYMLKLIRESHLSVKGNVRRHFYQILLCTIEIYGCWYTFGELWINDYKMLYPTNESYTIAGKILMSITPEAGTSVLNTNDPMLLWLHLVFFNGIWVVVPLILIVQSFNHLNLIARQLESVKKST